MQFLKKHHIAILYAVIALILVFFGFRLYGDSAKVGDVIFFAFFCSALLIVPAVEVGDKILKKLAELEPRQSASTGSVDAVGPRTRRYDLELALVSALAPYLAHNHKAGDLGTYIRDAAGAILGKTQSGFSESVRDHVAAKHKCLIHGLVVCNCGGGDKSSGAKADQAAEAEILAKGLTAPRVTKDQIQELMDKLIWRYEQPEGTTSTFAHAFLGTFYLATGHSACVSPENFNAELGMKYAREQAEGKARDKLWELEGYALAKSLGTV